jgi:hypothetical protein
MKICAVRAEFMVDGSDNEANSLFSHVVYLGLSAYTGSFIMFSVITNIYNKTL